jgi:dienelactone hydrolase
MPEQPSRRAGYSRRSLLRHAAGATLASPMLSSITASAAESTSSGATPTFRDHLLRCLGGPWPDLKKPADLDVRQESPPQRKQGYTLEHVSFAAHGDPLEPGDRIPAFVLIPDGVTASSPAPAIAVWHQHNGAWQIGKTEPAGLEGSPMHQTGAALAKEGYVVICPDALCFGQRQDPSGKLKRGDYERWQFLRYTLHGKCLAWKDILDMRRTIDYLVTRPEVQADRLGCYGHSMGSTHTWMIGPWDERLRCLVGNCCLPTYKGIEREKILHCFENFIPGLQQYGDTPDIAALIAPRGLHLNFGETDDGSPLEDVRAAMPRIAAAYAAAGAPQNFSYFIEEKAGHVLSDAMWAKAKQVFGQHLRKA